MKEEQATSEHGLTEEQARRMYSLQASYPQEKISAILLKNGNFHLYVDSGRKEAREFAEKHGGLLFFLHNKLEEVKI